MNKSKVVYEMTDKAKIWDANGRKDVEEKGDDEAGPPTIAKNTEEKVKDIQEDHIFSVEDKKE